MRKKRKNSPSGSRVNPRTGGGLSQPRTGGGVDFSPPPPPWDLENYATHREAVLDRPCKVLQKTFGSFFDEVKIEVTGCQKRSNFPKSNLFSQTLAIISITMQASKISKYPNDSPGPSLSICAFRLAFPSKMCAPEVIKGQNYVFLRGNVFYQLLLNYIR